MATRNGTPAAAGAGDDYGEFEGDPEGGRPEGQEGPGEAADDGDAPGSDAEEGDNAEGGQGPLDGDDADDDDLAGFGVTPARTPSRGESRLQRLANENRELKRQLAGAPRQGTAQPAAAPAGQLPGLETEQQFQARLQLMNPEDRMQAQLDRFRQESDARDRLREQQNAITNDKIQFEVRAQADKRYARWSDRVEAKHQELLRGGQFVPREVVFRFLLGEHLLSREGQQEVRRQSQRGQQRVQRQTTRPVNAGSDVGGGRRGQSEREARARRLENLNI